MIVGHATFCTVTVVVGLSILPVYLAHRLTREEAVTARGGGGRAAATAPVP